MTRARGLFETHLTVGDLSRSVAFYRDVVGLPPALQLPERDAAFFWVGGRGESMLGLWSIGSSPIGLRLTAAVYFEDPAGHLIEYPAMLDEPPRPERGIVPLSEWESVAADGRVEVVGHTGSRDELRALFEEAEDSPAALDAYIDAGDVLVARAGGRIVGQLQLVNDGDRSEIKNMAVERDHRGRGIGWALVDAALAAARRRDVATVVVATAAANTGNLRFYQRCGFRMRSVERDAFTPVGGYPAGTMIDGVELRDRVWLARELEA